MTMTYIKAIKAGFATATLAAALASTISLATPSTAYAQSVGKTIVMSIGKGQQINLPSSITDVVVGDPNVADVNVRSSRQIYIVAKRQGETQVYATDASGKTVYSATIRVGENLDSVSQMLAVAMPEDDIRVTTMNGLVLLTGTVRQPEDVAEAERLVQAFVGRDVQVVSRLKTATPMQVNLQVRIAEVSRSLAKEIGTNLASRNKSNGFQFGVNRNPGFVDIKDFDTSALPKLDASSSFGLPAGSLSLPFDPATGQFVVGGTQFDFKLPAAGNLITAAGKLFGIDVAAGFDLSERAGLISTLAQPNVTTVSGETGNFLAGGRFPIPMSSGFGSTSVTYEKYGVSLTYTPIVLADGRISLQIKTEVSDISSQGAVRLNGFEIPAISTRMAETTVELGSGQSFMIAGLMSNSASNSVDKIPGLGDIPVLGALAKSNGWRRNETELMIVVTPYLVNPISESEVKLPTDGLNTPNDLERVLLGKTADNKQGSARPIPTVAPNAPAGPDFGTVNDAPPALPKKIGARNGANSAGFSFDK
jgi:pilus assembly protein CpaC